MARDLARRSPGTMGSIEVIGLRGFSPAGPDWPASVHEGIAAGAPCAGQSLAPGQMGAARTGGVCRLGGVRVLWPAPVWQGVRLKLRDRLNGTDRLFEIGLSAGSGRTVVIAVLDEDEAVATWRSVSAATGLPMLIEAPDGTVSAPAPQLGRLALGPIRHRRCLAVLKGRRPRFLRRRKTGDAALFGSARDLT